MSYFGRNSQPLINHPPIITTLFYCLPSPLDSSGQSSVGRQRSAEGGKCLYLTSYLSVPQEFYSGTLPPALRRLLGHWNWLFIQGSDYRVRVLGVISIWNLDLYAQQNWCFPLLTVTVKGLGDLELTSWCRSHHGLLKNPRRHGD